MTTTLINNPDNNKWKKEIKDYEKNKKTLEWGSNPKPELITEKMMKQADLIYYQILQTYRYKKIEIIVKKNEIQTVKNNLARTKDNQMRIEQTFDLVTLEDKLNKFTNDPNYPKIKPHRLRANKEGTNASYNILSNHNLDKHHFDKIENRPNIKNDVILFKILNKKIFLIKFIFYRNNQRTKDSAICLLIVTEITIYYQINTKNFMTIRFF